MVDDLELCAECQRHVRSREASCPFCGHALARSAGMNRCVAAATVAVCVGVSLLAVGCYGPAPHYVPPPDKQQQEQATQDPQQPAQPGNPGPTYAQPPPKIQAR